MHECEYEAKTETSNQLFLLKSTKSKIRREKQNDREVAEKFKTVEQSLAQKLFNWMNHVFLSVDFYHLNCDFYFSCFTFSCRVFCLLLLFLVFLLVFCFCYKSKKQTICLHPTIMSSRPWILFYSFFNVYFIVFEMLWIYAFKNCFISVQILSSLSFQSIHTCRTKCVSGSFPCSSSSLLSALWKSKIWMAYALMNTNNKALVTRSFLHLYFH